MNLKQLQVWFGTGSQQLHESTDNEKHKAKALGMGILIQGKRWIFCVSNFAVGITILCMLVYFLRNDSEILKAALGLLTKCLPRS